MFDIMAQGEKLLVKGIKDFNLQQTFECGQCFRWEKEHDDSYTGIVFDKILNIKETYDGFLFSNTSENEFLNIWINYFDFNTNYSLIKKQLSIDKIMEEACGHGYGIRILKQDIWETIISFIISANNNIPRIKNIIRSICEQFGKPFYYNGNTYYSFPKVEDLAGIKVKDLDFCRCGYRANYIINAIEKISQGEIDIIDIKNKKTKDIKNELLKIKGIGPKVADCILLFSYGRHEVFPVDVWIKRTMVSLFLNEDSKEKDILKYAENKFGNLAGYAQQYLFYRYRKER